MFNTCVHQVCSGMLLKTLLSSFLCVQVRCFHLAAGLHAGGDIAVLWGGAVLGGCQQYPVLRVQTVGHRGADWR